MADPTPAEVPEKWHEIGQEVFAGAIESFLKADLTKSTVSGLGQLMGDLLAIAYTLTAPIGIGMAQGMSKAEDLIAPAFSDMASAAVNDVFNIDVPASTFSAARGRGARAGAGHALGKGLMDQIRGATTTLEPSEAAAAKYVEAMAQMALEDWFKGWFFEVLSSLVPQLDIGKIESYGALGDKVAGVLGLGRISNRVLAPLVDTTIVTPLRWQVSKQYRPTLLTPSQAARQIARGFGDKQKWTEHLRRAGYDEQCIEAILNEQARAFSPSDVRTFVSRGWWTNDQGLKHLRDQGYDERAATDALRLEGLRRIEQLETAEANAIISAYASGDIDHGTFSSALSAAVTVPSEIALLSELAEVRKAMNVKHLTIGQVESMVKSGVLSLVDYRRAAEGAGYDDFAVTALELQLRAELDKAKDVAEHRRELEAARAAEKLAKAEAAAAKRAVVEAARALDRRGKRADLERAAVRGLIPLARVGEIYAETYDADTAAVLMDLLEGDRLAYLAQLQARDDAAKRAAVRDLDIGSLEAAVVAGVLTLDELRGRLADKKLSPEDVAILADTLDAKMRDTAEAEAQRAAAAAAAKVKRISLSTLETLVRRGHRSMADYDATLADLGFDDAARAGMVELLQVRIDDDARARAEREAAEARLKIKGLSLEQFRRAVLLGTKTDADFQTFMVDQGFTVDAQTVLLAELRADVAEAEAARKRRADAEAARDRRDASVSDVARAARLGLISVATYQERLARSGYSPDDVALETDLLVAEMATIADTKRRRDEAEAAARNRGLSLAQLERAVRAGVTSIAAYRSAALLSGLSDDAAETLVALLQEQIAAAAAAAERRQAVAAAAAVKNLSLSQVESAVLAGVDTLDDYTSFVLALGYGADDAAVLAGVLAHRLDVLEEARARRDAIEPPAPSTPPPASAPGDGTIVPPEPAPPRARATLTQLEQGVTAGLLTIADYIAELRNRGYGDAPLILIDEAGRAVLDDSSEGPYDDTELLALLLQVKLDAAAAKRDKGNG